MIHVPLIKSHTGVFVRALLPYGLRYRKGSRRTIDPTGQAKQPEAMFSQLSTCGPQPVRVLVPYGQKARTGTPLWPQSPPKSHVGFLPARKNYPTRKTCRVRFGFGTCFHGLFPRGLLVCIPFVLIIVLPSPIPRFNTGACAAFTDLYASVVRHKTVGMRYMTR